MRLVGQKGGIVRGYSKNIICDYYRINMQKQLAKKHYFLDILLDLKISQLTKTS